MGLRFSHTPRPLGQSGLRRTLRILIRSRTILRSLTLNISLLIVLSLIAPAGLAGRKSGRANLAGQSQTQTKPKPAPQEETPAQDQDAPVRLNSRLVLVPVSASDAAGQPVKDLKAEDMVIEEEGRPQQVVALGEPGKTPVD